VLGQVEITPEPRQNMLLERQQPLRWRAEQSLEQYASAPGPAGTGFSELGGSFAEDQDATAHAGRARLLSPMLYQSSPSAISEASSSRPFASLMRCTWTPDWSRVTRTTSSAVK